MNKKHILIITGLAILLSHAFILYWIFLEAFFNPNYIGILEINRYNEANLEFIFMPISILLGIYATKETLKILRRQKQLNIQKDI